jgi:hypothetical protein
MIVSLPSIESESLLKYRPPKLDLSPPTRTKIDERREREAYDRAHPWKPLPKAVIGDGVVCELLFSDLEPVKAHYFLGEDDHWYRIDPPEKLLKGWAGARTPMNWRPTNRKLTPEKRAEIMRKANRSLYIGGRRVDDGGW